MPGLPRLALKFSSLIAFTSSLCPRWIAPRRVLACAALALLAASCARATTFTVTDTSDNAADTGSLRYALSNLASGTAATTNTITITATGTITLTSDLPFIGNGVTITGPGANQLTIDGANAYLIILISGGDTAVSGVTIARGSGYKFGANNYAGGGAFVYSGSGTFNNCTFIDNTSNHGGGIDNYGTLTVTNSTFYNNTVTLDSSGSAYGGAIENLGTATITNSTFYQNSSLDLGGAISNQDTLTLTNDTFAGNSAPGVGGVANLEGTTTVNNSVFSDNSSQAGGASIAQGGGTVNGNSNVYYNNRTGGTESDCDQCTTGSPGSDGNILAASNPLPLPLGWYGGTTETLALAPGSAAICAGSSTYAVDASSNPLTGDQRGFVMDPSCASGSVDAGAVQTDQYVVTTLTDSTNAATTCTGGATCSLRDAIGLANASGGDIAFKSSLTSTSAPGAISLGSALPAISAAEAINILGPGANQLTVNGGFSSFNSFSVFTVNSGATATLYGLTITNGYVSGANAEGGAINSAGTVAILADAISGNHAIGNSGGGNASGGGIYSTGALTVIGSTVSGNSAIGGSGGGNAGGGGIFSTGPLTISGSTVSGSSAVGGASGGNAFGGGIFSFSPLTIYGSTVYGNSAVYGAGGTGSAGGGIYAGGTLTLTNSIVAGDTNQTSNGQDISGTLVPTSSYNVIGNGAGMTGISNGVSGNQVGTTASPVDAELSSLQYNGAGATVQTLIPLPGSPAICAGLTSKIPSGVTTDERGFPLATPSYCTSGQIDAGAVQTNYTSVAFVQQPAGSTASVPGTVVVNTAILPAPTVEVLETNTLLSSNNTDAVNGVPVTLTYSGGAGELSAPDNVLTETTANGVATYTLAPNAVGTDFTLSTQAIAVVGSQELDSVTSYGFNVISLATTTTASDVYALASSSSQSVPLSATVTNPDQTVNEGEVQFSVSGGVGTATSGAVSGGSASVSYALPGGLSPGQYAINATYTDPSGNLTTSSDNTHNLYIQSATVTTDTNGNITEPWSGSSQSVPITITITAGGVGVNGGQLTIPVFVTQTIIVTKYTSTGTPYQTTEQVYRIVPRTVVISSSPYQFSLDLPAGMTAGTYALEFSYSDGTGLYGPSSDTTHTLTVTAPAFVVNNSGDAGAGATDCSPDPTGSGAGACTLRDALAGAAADGGANITFDATVFTAPTTITLTSGVLDLPSYTTITGPTAGNGANLVTVSGGGTQQAFSVASGTSGAVINDLNITNGAGGLGGAIVSLGSLTVNHSSFTNNSASPAGSSAAGSGGAIFSQNGTLVVNNSSFTSNSASPPGASSSGYGGAICSIGGTLTIAGSTFSNNSASPSSTGGNAYGGAIFSTSTSLTVSNSTFSGNTASASGSSSTAFGGAIWGVNTVTLSDDTFSGNSASASGTGAQGDGGVIWTASTITVSDSVFSGNSASTGGGGIYSSAGTLTVNSSVFSSDAGGDCFASSGCPTNGTNGNVVGVASALLAPLGNYGGPTETMIPLPGSPAICLISPSTATGTDQRGDPRNTTYNSTSCQDAGAVQTDYSLEFSTEPEPHGSETAIYATGVFKAGATVEENGAPFFDGKDTIPVAFTLTTGSGTLTGGAATASATTGIALDPVLKISLPGASDQLTASLELNGGLALTQTSNTFSVIQVPTTTSLGVSVGSGTPSASIQVTPGQSVTLTAHVTTSVNLEPTGIGTPVVNPDTPPIGVIGTVSFYDNGTLLNTTPATLTRGVATYSTSALAPGVTHTLTATYNGTPVYATSSNTSTATVTVAPLDFTINLSGLAAQTVVPGQSVSFKFTVKPDYGSYAGMVTFTATGLPAGATATFSPATIAANGGPQTVTVTIQTAATTAMEHAPSPPTSTSGRAAPLALAFLLLFGVGTLRKRTKALRNLLCIAVLLVGGAAAAVLSGCGGFNGFFAQAPQTYTITLTATAGGLNHSGKVTLNVQ
jgi:predicted outer membrane repeat protein